MKVIFLDRDGVINEFPGNGNYVKKVKEFKFLPGSLDAIRMLTKAGYTIFVISNQAGVGKGVFSKDKLNRITHKMLSEVRKHGGEIKKALYCTHRTEEGCSCRKPNIGLIQQAMSSINKTLRTARNAYFVGDTKADMLTGHNAGCRTIFVLSGRETRHHLNGWPVKPDYITKDLLEAVQVLCNHHIPTLSDLKKIHRSNTIHQ